MIREVQLKLAFANHYPELTPGRWYTAAAVAGLVKGRRIIREGRKTRFTDRLLQAAHFEFRGGGPRRGTWMGLRTRHLDRHPVPGTGFTARANRKVASLPAHPRSTVLASALQEWDSQDGRPDNAREAVAVGGGHDA